MHAAACGQGGSRAGRRSRSPEHWPGGPAKKSPAGPGMYSAREGKEPGKIQPKHLKGHSVKLMVAKLKANQKRDCCRAHRRGLGPWCQPGMNHEQLPALRGEARPQNFSSEA